MLLQYKYELQCNKQLEKHVRQPIVVADVPMAWAKNTCISCTSANQAMNTELKHIPLLRCMSLLEYIRCHHVEDWGGGGGD